MKFKFEKGMTDPSGDCGNFAAGISVDERGEDWPNRIECYGSTPAEAEEVRDIVLATLESVELLRAALEHIQKTAGQSRTQTRRLRWISKRAELALAGRPYVSSEHDLPVDGDKERIRLRRKNAELRMMLGSAQGDPS